MFIIIGGDGKEYGPATTEQIRTWLAGGRASLDTKAKALGSEEWRRLGDYAEFASPAAPPLMSDVPPLPMSASTEAPGNNASLGARFGGAFIDGFLTSLCWLPAAFAFQRVVGPEIMAGRQPPISVLVATMSEATWKAVPFLAVLAIVQCTLLALRSQSIGKIVVGTRIVRFRDGGKASFVQTVLLRSALLVLLQRIPIVGGLFWLVDVCFIFGDQRRCVHDYIAGTKVVPA